jgi:hypothetical protein
MPTQIKGKPAQQAADGKIPPEQDVEEAVQDLDEALEVIPFTYSITAYGADYPVDSVVKRINSSDIIVPTFNWEPKDTSAVVGFQREYVWPRPKADRALAREEAPAHDWRSTWSVATPLHYSDCPLYSLLVLGVNETTKSRSPIGFDTSAT